MRKHRSALVIGLCVLQAGGTSWAQQQLTIDPVTPTKPFFIRNYAAPEVPAARLTNSERLRSLMRAGTLYLTAQDAIALALENNIDIEIARYNPVIATWNVERAKAGGALPGVPNTAAQAGTVASGQGVAGSQAAAGVSINGSNANNNSSTNATISQVGPVVQTLDPLLQDSTSFSHTSIPQPDPIQSQTAVLISNSKAFNTSFQQGYLYGGSVTVNYSDHYLNENSPTDVLNPSVAPNISISVQQSLLRGFGKAVNARNITVAKMNLKDTDLNFRGLVISVVAQVLTRYYALAASFDDIKAKQSALDVAQQLRTNVAEQIRVGALAPLELTNADSQVANGQKGLVDAQTNLRQQELQLKNLISRNGLADPVLAAARIMPVDKIVMPEADDLPALGELVKQAAANRSDLNVEQANLEISRISALGTRNGLLPVAQGFAGTAQAGLAGTPRTVLSSRGPTTADPYFVGGIGTGLGQVFRRDFPTNRAGVFVQVPIHNRLAQADFGIDQLQLRQSELSAKKDSNQLEVDVQNYVIALRQARARYDASVRNRVLQEQLLDAEQKKYRLGASTTYNVIQQQRDLVAAQSSEVGALVSYSDARIALDQTIGATLETNHISIAETRNGVITRVSTPTAPQP